MRAYFRRGPILELSGQPHFSSRAFFSAATLSTLAFLSSPRTSQLTGVAKRFARIPAFHRPLPETLLIIAKTPRVFD
jgi:hypothetical protein